MQILKRSSEPYYIVAELDLATGDYDIVWRLENIDGTRALNANDISPVDGKAYGKRAHALVLFLCARWLILWYCFSVAGVIKAVSGTPSFANRYVIRFDETEIEYLAIAVR